MREPVPWIAQVAAHRGLRYEADADERWIRAWEPFATLRIPLRYEHQLMATGGVGSLTLARMINTVDAPMPNGQVRSTEISSWITITQDERIKGTLAVTSDLTGPFAEPLDLVTMKRRASGDAWFDAAFATFAPTPADVVTTLTGSLKKLLMGWRIPIHVEIRPGGFVLVPVALGADPQSLNWLIDSAHVFGEKAAKGAT